MARRLVLTASVVLFSFVAHSHAALYEFRLGGIVTRPGYPDVQIGDPFMVRYNADSQDLNPSATIGAYDCGPATVTFPNRTITPLGGPHLQVTLAGAGVDAVHYLQISPNYYFSAQLVFPSGTLTSDALPLVLPLSLANHAEAVEYFFAPFFRGNITSYAATAIPEPSAFTVMAATVLAFSRRAARSRPPVRR